MPGCALRDNIETLFGAIDDGGLAVRIPKHARQGVRCVDADFRGGGSGACRDPRRSRSLATGPPLRFGNTGRTSAGASRLVGWGGVGRRETKIVGAGLVPALRSPPRTGPLAYLNRTARISGPPPTLGLRYITRTPSARTITFGFPPGSSGQGRGSRRRCSLSARQRLDELISCIISFTNHMSRINVLNIICSINFIMPQSFS